MRPGRRRVRCAAHWIGASTVDSPRTIHTDGEIDITLFLATLAIEVLEFAFVNFE
eukprot:SAG11_NODE_26603_length_343_cov_0.639344_1_plen_54_part_10